MLQDFVNWYLAPWRKLGRKPFNTIFFIVSIVGMVISVSGMASGAGGMLRPLMDLAGGGTQNAEAIANGVAHGLPGREAGAPADASSVDDAALTQRMNGMLGQGGALQGLAGVPGLGGGAAAPAASGVSIPWGALLNDLLLLALAPLVLMRLRDMGKRGTLMWVLLGLTYATTVVELLEMVGPSFGGLGTLLGVVGFGMWGWLCVAKSHKEQMENLARSSTLLMTARQPYGMVAGDEAARATHPDDAPRTYSPDPAAPR